MFPPARPPPMASSTPTLFPPGPPMPSSANPVTSPISGPTSSFPPPVVVSFLLSYFQSEGS